MYSLLLIIKYVSGEFAETPYNSAKANRSLNDYYATIIKKRNLKKDGYSSLPWELTDIKTLPEWVGQRQLIAR